MKKQKSILLTAAFGLIMSALSAQTGQCATAQAARHSNIPISSLPFNITAPGTYVLTGNLNASPVPPGASIVGMINISTAIAGPVIVDLQGFTITGDNTGFPCVVIGLNSQGIDNAYPITIRNGTIKTFATGVSSVNGGNVSNITVQNIVFYQSETQSPAHNGVYFSYVTSAYISNCTFYGTAYGIADYFGKGGSFTNNTFVNTRDPDFYYHLDSGL